MKLPGGASVSGVQRLVEYTPTKRPWPGCRRDSAAPPCALTIHLYKDSFPAISCREAHSKNLKRYILPKEPLPSLIEEEFKEARWKWPANVSQDSRHKMIDRLGVILQLRQDIVRRFGTPAPPKPNVRQTLLGSENQLGQNSRSHKTKESDLGRIGEVCCQRTFWIPFLFEQLVHLPRYLKALLIRSGAPAAQNPPKDQDRARQIAPYREALLKFESTPT